MCIYGLKNSICTLYVGVVLTAVLRIRIRLQWINVFWGLLDPDPDLDPSNMKQKKIVRKPLIYCLLRHRNYKITTIATS